MYFEKQTCRFLGNIFYLCNKRNKRADTAKPLDENDRKNFVTKSLLTKDRHR